MYHYNRYMTTCLTLKLKDCKKNNKCKWVVGKGCKKICQSGYILDENNICFKDDASILTNKIKSTVKKNKKTLTNILKSRSRLSNPITCKTHKVTLPDNNGCTDLILIDRGGFGCVISPPISDEKNTKSVDIQYMNRNNNDIAKLYIDGKKNYLQELEEISKIDAIDPTHFFTVKMKGATAIDGGVFNNNNDIKKCLRKTTTKNTTFYQNHNYF